MTVTLHPPSLPAAAAHSNATKPATPARASATSGSRVSPSTIERAFSLICDDAAERGGEYARGGERERGGSGGDGGREGGGGGAGEEEDQASSLRESFGNHRKTPTPLSPAFALSARATPRGDRHLEFV